MRALTFHGPRDVRYETVPDPGIAAPTDAIVEVERSAICGSDLHPYRGDERGLDPGTVLGHEFSGRVIAVGPEVRRFTAGDRVTSPFSTSCGTCFYCASGLTARCERGQLFGWVEGGRGLHGAQAEYVRVPLGDSTLVAIPDDLSSEVALLAGDVLATGMFAAEQAEAGPGRVVAVVGCGPVGLMAVLAARWRGAERVFAIDTLAERLALAGRLGGEPVAVADQPLAAIAQATGGRGADAVIEAVGSPAASRLAFALARPGATLAAVGVHTEPHLAMSPGEIYDRNLCYRAGRCPARRLLEPALGVARAHTADLEALISHRLPLEQGPDAYRMFDGRLAACTKVVFCFPASP